MRLPPVLRRFGSSRSGVSAVEFALVAPIMVLMFIGTIELPRAYGVSQKAHRATRAMADLISRSNLASVDDIYAAGRAILAPYPGTDAKIILTMAGVYLQKDGSYKAKVCSSTASKATPYKAQADLGTPPPSDTKDKARYVMAEMTLTYTPIFALFPALNGLSFEKKVTWPVRSVSSSEIILPGGVACPTS